MDFDKKSKMKSMFSLNVLRHLSKNLDNYIELLFEKFVEVNT